MSHDEDKEEIGGAGYVVDPQVYHKSRAANIIVQDAMGIGHPGASFTLRGSLQLGDDGRTLTLHVAALGPFFPPGAGLEKLQWEVFATLVEGNVVIEKQRVNQHYQHYLTNINITVVGEAVFCLPLPEEGREFELKLKGSYVANCGVNGYALIPRGMINPATAVYLEKRFSIKQRK